MVQLFFTFVFLLILDLPIDVLTLQVHLMNTVYVIINSCVTARPVKLKHFYHSFLFCSVFIVFSIIYYWYGGLAIDGSVYIYPFLDWSKPLRTSAFVIIMLLSTFPLHAVFYIIYRLRQYWATSPLHIDLSLSTQSLIWSAVKYGSWSIVLI